ncbi:MAG TPA: alpha-amylase family protein [Thermoanaerobaculia bacterium]|nr:alpha-amylase family protein [Thermoanaerobaculia bacterium]
MITDLWYKNAIVYCLNVETFMDVNGDGRGDFEGLMRCLDYLAGLGVTCLWLLPFYPSPRRDDGYDVADYYGVDPRYGTPGDFVEFMHQADSHGIRVVVDLVINHTSIQHPWFQAARKDPRSKYRDWYVWSKTRPRDWNKGMVFPGVQKSTWSYDAVARQWYFHRFYDFQPDLNTMNPEVRTEIKRIMGYWLELGVAGFRVDALPFVISTKGPDVQPRHDFDLLREMREFLEWRRGDAVLLAEANVLPNKDLEYFGDRDDRMHMMFNFFVNQNVFYAMASGDTRPLVRALERTRQRPVTAQWGHFLRNNDELDLGRLTDKQRDVVFAKFGPDKKEHLYGRGIRRRLAPMLDGDRRRMELAYSLMFTLPGTPVIRYGDEIGMGDNLALPEREAFRTPMQWSTEEHGGFSAAKRTVLPVIDDEVFGYRHVNAADQRRDPNSFLNWTERVMRMRKEVPEIGWGEWQVLDCGAPQVLALRYDWRGNSVVVAHNVDAKPHTIRLSIAGGERAQLVNLLSNDHSDGDGRGAHTIAVEGYGYRWYRVGGLGYILNRERA